MLFLGLSFNIPVISFMSMASIIDISAFFWDFKIYGLLNWQYDILFSQDAHEFFHVLSSTLDDEMVMMALYRLF